MGRKTISVLLTLILSLSLLSPAFGENTAFNGNSLVLLPGGSFLMGSPDTERQRQEDETQHEVTISAFYVDPFEVRQSDYERIMGRCGFLLQQAE